jgi:hypothetical protein
MLERWQSVLLTGCTLLAVGCDPVRTTSQTISLRVSKTTSGEAVGNVQVSLKYDFETAEPLSKETRQPPKEWHEHMRKFWDEFPWFSGVTDKHGEAAIDVVYTGIDRTWGSTPPAESDGVTGKPFLVRLKEEKSPEEQVSVLMKPGEILKGKIYTVTVIKIQSPHYVPTK